MVKARPRKEILENLQKDLTSGKISKMRPFGHALQYSFENARIDDNENPDYAIWWNMINDECVNHIQKCGVTVLIQ